MMYHKPLIVCGGRSWPCDGNDDEVLEYMDMMKAYDIISDVIDRGGYTCLFHGASSGADMFAEAYSKHKEFKCYAFPAEWSRIGRAAGPVRNEEMARKASGIIAFRGGKGTADMLRRARIHGLKIEYSEE